MLVTQEEMPVKGRDDLNNIMNNPPHETSLLFVPVYLNAQGLHIIDMAQAWQLPRVS
jgi:hypothetical protein